MIWGLRQSLGHDRNETDVRIETEDGGIVHADPRVAGFKTKPMVLGPGPREVGLFKPRQTLPRQISSSR